MEALKLVKFVGALVWDICRTLYSSFNVALAVGGKYT